VQNWYGTITVAQLDNWLDDGLLAMGKTATDPASAALARADQLTAEFKTITAYREAITAYREALTAGGPNWPRFTRAAESLMLTYELGGSAVGRADCAKAAMEYAPKLPRGQSFVNVMRVGIGCASTPEETRVLEPLALEALKAPEGFADDKAGIYSSLISIARRQKDTEAVKKYAADMWAFLEQQARSAPSAEARASLDSWRMSAAGALGDPALAIPALQASERDLPDDYNPPSRLANIYTQMGRLDDALAANERALAKAYGPRKVSLLTSRASLFEKKGDKAAAKRTLEEAVKFAETLPGEQGAKTVERLKQQLAKYNAPEQSK
jgi:tetratricopeptide (TPR) repeat protein